MFPVNLSVNVTINVQTLQELPAALHQIKAALAFDSGPLQKPSYSEPQQTVFSAPAAANSGALSRKPGTAYRQVVDEYQQLLSEGPIPDQGWGDVKEWPPLFAALPSETRKVVQRAIANGGHISRAEVYEVLGRPQEQSLKGFTRPVNKLMEVLKAKGQVRADAEPLLLPIYETSKTYQQAQGFKVPVQVISQISSKQ
jgi:hypothetical protein